MLLSSYPELGPARPDLAPGLRYFISGQHLILYQQFEDGVEIVRVVHGARHLPDLI